MWITQQVEQTYFLYKLTMQNLDEILLRKYCKVGICCYLFFWTHKNQEKKYKKNKIQKYKRIQMKKAQKIALD